ncbi:serine hydrolase [Streptomyces longwoodensis]|uniref:serine hydrolase n=1 Tax=Streptomyces longwoodensis TaxID=68231 RepID=UPI0022515091|nr:serine hydrolase [Streptomyces longwoodensis]MCX4998121.1 class A beta-lactamase-related serine hydrolase [Streptomyces longwoodensis]
MTHGTSARRAAPAVVALTTGLLISGAAVATPAAATAPAVSCTSAKPTLAAELKKDITAALATRKGTVAVGVYDRTTATTCTLRASTAYDSASVVKVTVLAALLYDAQAAHRALTTREKTLATNMITKSDNASTSTLWKQLGPTKIKKFLTAAAMTQTKPGANNYWGLTQITVTDEQKLLRLVTARNAVLTDASRSYVSTLMGKVVADQRWGTPYGRPANVSWHVKNGWLQRATQGWRVHSVGTFTGGGHDYTITVLTHGNSTMSYGITTIQAVAKVVHRDLAAG